MKRHERWMIAVALVLFFGQPSGGATADSISGRWRFTVDYPSPNGHGEETFEFDQKDSTRTFQHTPVAFVATSGSGAGQRLCAIGQAPPG